MDAHIEETRLSFSDGIQSLAKIDSPFCVLANIERFFREDPCRLSSRGSLDRMKIFFVRSRCIHPLIRGKKRQISPPNTK